MKVTVVQPKYYSGNEPDEVIAAFLIDEIKKAKGSDLVVLPEYSNAGGLSEADREIEAMKRAPIMYEECKKLAKELSINIVVNFIHNMFGPIKNTTFFIDRQGEVRFMYHKQHLPPSELKLGMEAGNPGEKCKCCAEIDGIKYAFMTCYDVYFNEQIEYMAEFGPDIILIPGYQRGERVDIIQSQAKLTAFRCNSYVARSSYSMDSTEKGGSSMFVSPEGIILQNMGANVGSITEEFDPKHKYMRTAGFGGDIVPNNQFISDGLCPEAF